MECFAGGMPRKEFVGKYIFAQTMITHTLIALVESGPLWGNDVPSKSDLQALLDNGHAVNVVVKGFEGYVAATPKGAQAYCKFFNVNDIVDAKHKRAVPPDTVAG